MPDGIFESADWFRALTLAERAIGLRDAEPPAVDTVARVDRASDSVASIDIDLAQRELAHWRAQAPFTDDRWFAQRLALDGVGERELFRVLGEPVGAVRARCAQRPPWLAEIERAYERDPRPIEETLPIDDAGSVAQPHRFLDPIEPLIRRARERFDARLAELTSGRRALPFDRDRASELLAARIAPTLQRLVERVLVLELNVARMHGGLEGTTPEERFASFVRAMRDRDRALAWLAEYPVLARSIVRALDRWEQASLEFLRHLVEDWSDVRASFSAQADPGRLVRIHAGLGDAHRGGRSVLIAGFESGLDVVYKPRSLAVDAHFQDLLGELNELGADPPLRRLVVLDRGDHGWIEFARAAECASKDEVRRFYERQGAYLAVLHALAGVDFHFENLIASGEHPVLVDLETLFHPELPMQELADADPRLVRAACSRSVLRIGLLPNRMFSDDGDAAGFDLSGLSGEAGQLTPDALLQWRDVGTDEMHADRERALFPPARNLPTFEGVDARAPDHVGDILRGFRGAYGLLVRHRDALLARGGAIARFLDDDVRVVVRPTRVYGLLLSEIAHPDFQRDALELARFLDKLWVAVADAKHLADVVAVERDDVEQGDIPYFSTRPGSRDLCDSRGRRIPEFFAASGFDLVAQRLRALGPVDLERQCWFIEGSMATSSVSPSSLRWPTYELARVERAPSPLELRERMLVAARAIGNRLERLALSDSNAHEPSAAWIGFKFESGRWQLVALPDDLYSGIPGIVHFLAYLGDVTGDARYRDLARAALAPLRTRWRERRCNLGTIGAFSGLGGLAYGFAHWSRLWNDASLLDDARDVIELAAARIANDEDLDVVGGSAGLIPCLASLDRVAPSPRWIEMARACGDRLIERAVKSERGVAWLTRIADRRPATGFSHGAAGIGWALFELTALTGDDRYAEIGLQAFEYEATQYDAAEANWLDPEGQAKTDEARDSTLMMAWCYGAPGIGLARLRAISRTGARRPHARIARDVEIAVRSTLERGFGRNHCLCHGDLGNLDFLMHAARTLNDGEIEEAWRRKAAGVLASIETGGVLCGMPLGIESVALMNGLAGIGFGLLRLAEPDRAPSVLALEAPPR